MQYWTCPKCGSNLDFGESCDCEEEKRKEEDLYMKMINFDSETGQMSFCLEGEG